MRVALIEPTVDAECLTTAFLAQIRASLPFLAGALRDHGIYCRVYTEELLDVGKRLPTICRSFDLIGFSVTINTVRRALELARMVRKLNPEQPILFGGHCVRHYAKELLSSGDYLLSGRAEVTLPELIHRLQQGLSLDSMPNLSRLVDGTIHHHPEELQTRDHFSDIGAIEGYGGFSELRGPLGFRRPPLHSLFTSTGCVRRCRFCVTDRHFLPRDPEHVYADLEAILDHHRTPLPPRIMVVDDCPFGNSEHLKAILQRMAAVQRRRRFTAMMQFHVQPLIRDPQLASLLSAAGVHTLLIGFETVSDNVLAEERKGNTVADNRAAIAVCRDHDITPYGYFVTGFDGDGPDEVQAVFRFIREERLVAQVLPLGVMDHRTLDPWSFGATLFVSHRPAKLSPWQLQQEILTGYDQMATFRRLFTLTTRREYLFQLALILAWQKWRPRMVKHLSYLKLLEKFSAASGERRAASV